MAYGKGIEEVFSMQESIEDINTKDPRTGNYSIPTEVIVQKYLKERINPKLPTTSILAALDQRKWEEKQVAEQRGPQQSVLEETISETETVMPTINPMMPQGIAQGQPRPMPGQMPRQMAGLQRPPMPGRVPPQQRMRTGIPMMAAAGGYVPNFADGGIIGYKTGDLVKGTGLSPTYGERNINPFNYLMPGNRPGSENITMTDSIVFPNMDEDTIGLIKRKSELETKIQNRDGVTFEDVNELKELTKIVEEGGGYDVTKLTEKGEVIGSPPTTLDVKSINKDSGFTDPNEGKKFLSQTESGVIKPPENKKEDDSYYTQDELLRQGGGGEEDDLFEPVDSILIGDDAVKAYEDRIGVSPFVALSEKYEQEIGENIAEAKKQSIGKMLFNFGSELTRSGQLGEAAVAAGRDIDKDMDRLIELKREQRKVGFDIAKIAEAERQTKGKIGMTAAMQAEKDNLTKSLKKREFELIEEKNAYDKIYKGEMGEAALIRAGTERDYYKGQDSLGKQEDRIQAAVIQETFGGPGTENRKRFAKAEAIFLAAQTKNPGKSDDEVIDIAFANDPSGGKIFKDTKLLKEKNEGLIRRMYQNSTGTKKTLFGGGLNDPSQYKVIKSE